MSTEIELASEIWKLKQEKDDFAATVKDLNGKIESKEWELIQLLIEEGKSDTGKISGVGKFIITRSKFPSVTAADLPGFINSIRKTDDFGMVKETIPAATLKKFLKERIEDMEGHYMDNPAQFDKLVVLLPDEMEPTISNVVKHELSKVGVRMFDKVGLQHRDKGKL